jgi:polysaccharide pyruvyl transferase WcaK-like protein
MILVDTGLTENRNMGDQAILHYTRKQLKKRYKEPLDFLAADYPLHRKYRKSENFLKFIKTVAATKIIYLTCGGIFKDSQKILVYRKFFLVLLAKIFRKKIIVDSQTIDLKGFNRILFKILFNNILVNCRDHFSLKECQKLNLKCKYKDDITLYKPPEKELSLSPYAVIDSRFIKEHVGVYHSQKLKEEYKKLAAEIHKNFKHVIYTKTAHSPEHWRITKMQIENADLNVTCSFHSAIFSSNNNVKTICLYSCDYYHKKFSVLNRCIKIDLRGK